MITARRTSRSTTEILEQDRGAIPLIPVVSSQIAAVGYDASSRELVIRFRASGGQEEPIYSYDGVPIEVARGLVAAASPGIYFHRHIRHAPYPYRRHGSGS